MPASLLSQSPRIHHRRASCDLSTHTHTLSLRNVPSYLRTLLLLFLVRRNRVHTGFPLRVSRFRESHDSSSYTRHPFRCERAARIFSSGRERIANEGREICTRIAGVAVNSPCTDGEIRSVTSTGLFGTTRETTARSSNRSEGFYFRGIFGCTYAPTPMEYRQSGIERTWSAHATNA